MKPNDPPCVARDVECLHCKAPPGKPCLGTRGPWKSETHYVRRYLFQHLYRGRTDTRTMAALHFYGYQPKPQEPMPLIDQKLQHLAAQVAEAEEARDDEKASSLEWDLLQATLDAINTQAHSLTTAKRWAKIGLSTRELEFRRG